MNIRRLTLGGPPFLFALKLPRGLFLAAKRLNSLSGIDRRTLHMGVAIRALVGQSSVDFRLTPAFKPAHDLYQTA